jgi:hypothetical protein
VVDAERGSLHSDTALADGERCQITELQNIVVDPEVGATLLELEIPPGVGWHDHSNDRLPVPTWHRRRRLHLHWPIVRS